MFFFLNYLYVKKKLQVCAILREENINMVKCYQAVVIVSFASVTMDKSLVQMKNVHLLNLDAEEYKIQKYAVVKLSVVSFIN